MEMHKNIKLLTLHPGLCFTVEHQKSVQQVLALATFHVNHQTHRKQENVLCQAQIDSVRLKRNDFFYLFFIFLPRRSL